MCRQNSLRLRGIAVGSRFLDRDVDRLLDGSYLETFAIDRVVEELDTVAANGAVACVATPALDASAALHRDESDRFGPVLGGSSTPGSLRISRAGSLRR